MMDLTRDPEVIFVSPESQSAYGPRHFVEVKALLVDRELDMVIGRITDTSRKEEFTYTTGTGETKTVQRYPSLEPTVAVKDSGGRTVAKGKMPFG